MDGARGMVERGDYVVPYYRGQPFFDKPALTYWLMAASFWLFGPTPEAARLVSALAALGVLLATFWLALLLFSGRASALAGAAVLATTSAFMAFGRVAMSDMLLALWSTLAMALALAARRPGAPFWVAPALGAALGLGFQTKGPIGLLLPGLGILLAWRRRGERPPVRPAATALAATLFALFGLGWFVAVYLRIGASPLGHFFLRENVARFAGETYDAEREPWYYLVTYLAEGLPWSLFLPACLFRFARGGDGEPEGGARLLLAWAGLMLVPLSLARGKIDYYLLPLYPALSLVIGRYFTLPWHRAARGWGRLVLVLLAAGLAHTPAVPGRVPAEWLPGPAAQLVFSLAALAGVVATLACAVRLRPARTLAVLAAVTASLFLILASVFLPAFRSVQPSRAVVEDVSRERRYRPDAALVACEDPLRVERDVLFHARLAAQRRCDLWNPLASRLPYLALLGPEERRSLSSIPALREIGEYRYLPATTLSFRGLRERPQPQTLTLVANYATTDPAAEVKRKRDRRRALERQETEEGGRSDR